MRATPLVTRIVHLALSVIDKASRGEPADRSLRHALRNAGGLSREDSAQVTRSVFAYYRWLGWLDKSKLSARHLQQALDLAERWEHDPLSFTDSELVERAVPAWVSEETDITPAWAKWLQNEATLWLRAKPACSDHVVSALRHCRPFGPGPLQTCLQYLGRADLFKTRPFADGEFQIQDLHSQAVGLICSPKPGSTWLDACAGEGGKTLHLSDLMGNTGLIWAVDRAAWRLQLLKRRAARSKAYNYRSALWNGMPPLPTKTRFDGILIDAPCSGLGTWQRNPHARWTTTAQDVHELAGVQLSLLLNTAGALKPQGNLIYSVCTTTRAETVQVAKAFDARMPGLARLELKNPLQPDAPPVKDLFLRSEDTGGNGMFVAGWKLTR